MNRFDVAKVLAAGFKVFRIPLRCSAYSETPIHVASGKGGWKVYCNYPSYAAARRAFLELMKDTKNLEG